MASAAEEPRSEPENDDAATPADGEPAPAEAANPPAEAAPAAGAASRGIERARRLLVLAGRVLDPNASDGPDPVLGSQLLRDALVFAADGDTDPVGDASARFEASTGRLRERGILARAAGSEEQAEKLLVTLAGARADVDTREIELFVTKVVDAAEGHDATLRGERLRRRLLAALALLTVLSVLSLMIFERLRYPWRAYAFHASSTELEFPQDGHLGDQNNFDLVLHTKQEKGPWVEIDLFSTRLISRVAIRQRKDCCNDRGLPMIVEVAGEDKAWREVGQRDTKFGFWDVRFEERPVRWVRIRSTSNTVLHFTEIIVE